MTDQQQPTAFFLKGPGALVILFFLTLTMTPSQPVNYLRSMIAVGMAVVVLKIALRRYRPHWLPERFRGGHRR